MPVCPACGQSNPAPAEFCMSCGSVLPAGPAHHEARKTVTVLFCDVEGSTQLADRLDSESVRQLMMRFFREMQVILERHGGTVEKYIGDAIMAVFGVPRLHEDDALRAVRAAWDMQVALERLKDEFESRWGTRFKTRIGVNTGEVVVGDAAAGQALVVGDAVNVAARLEQAAPAGDTLVGAETYALVRDHVDVVAVGPLSWRPSGPRSSTARPAVKASSSRSSAQRGLASPGSRVSSSRDFTATP